MEQIHIVDSTKLLVCGDIPEFTELLAFDNEFNQQLLPGIIPASVIRVCFNCEFNQQLLPGVLPESVKFVSFGYNFNQPLMPNSIPQSVTKLNFGKKFNQQLNLSVLPASLKYISLDENYTHELTTLSIPESVHTLKIFGMPKLIDLNPSIKILCTRHNYKLFAKNGLHHISFYCCATYTGLTELHAEYVSFNGHEYIVSYVGDRERYHLRLINSSTKSASKV